MKRTPMVDKVLHHECLGEMQLAKHIYALVDVEKYFIDQCQKKKIFWSYDMSANEPYYFHTLNYTTYAGMFIIHPLQPEFSLRQMYEASRYTGETNDYISYLKSRLDKKVANKYDIEAETLDKDFKALVVLPGDNKIKTNICLRNLKHILGQHGDDIIFKPHPLTHQKTIDEMCDIIGLDNKDNIAPIKSNLYELLPKAELVYTSHISESAIYSKILDIPIRPIDQFDKRSPASFTHINYFFFNEKDSIKLINPMFTSHKSGVVCPELDHDWKKKIDNYIDYILDSREYIKDHYYTGEPNL